MEKDKSANKTIEKKTFRPYRPLNFGSPLRPCNAAMGEAIYSTGSTNNNLSMDSVSALRDEIMAELSTVKNLLTRALKDQASNTALLKQLIKKEVQVPRVSRFPLKSKKDIIQVEEDIEQNEEEIENEIRIIIDSGGIVKNLYKILSNDIILSYNYDGIKGKSPFKDFKKLNSVMFRALSRAGFTEHDYVKELKKAFQTAKNRLHKAKCIKAQKENKKF